MDQVAQQLHEMLCRQKAIMFIDPTFVCKPCKYLQNVVDADNQQSNSIWWDIS